MKQKFAAYDAQRLVNGFYDSIDSPVPDGVQAVAITDEQYAFLLAGYSAGKRMAFDGSLSPVLLDALPLTREGFSMPAALDLVAFSIDRYRIRGPLVRPDIHPRIHDLVAHGLGLVKEPVVQ